MAFIIGSVMLTLVSVGDVDSSGICTYYSAGVFERVADYRGLELQPGDTGYAAVLNCAQLGERIWLQVESSKFVGPLLVADCAQREHLAELMARSLVAEFNYEMALELEMTRPIRCRMVTESIALSQRARIDRLE